MNQAIFREYDIRGLADKDLNDNDVYLLGRALGTYFQNSNTVVVGQDVRLSSPRIFKSLTRGINDSGCDVVDIGVVPTPGLYFSLFYYDIGNGVMITASHNPKEFNGFKICHNKGTIYGQEIQKLRRLAEEKKFSSGHGKIIKKQIEEDYINYLLKDINIDNKLKVAVDTGNGTCGPIVEKILQRLHIEHHILYKEPDGNFPGHLPDPVVVKYIQELIVLVKKGNFSAGLGFDGDGDRLGVVDENGDIIWGDVLLAIYAQELLQRMPGAKIIFEVKCSRGLIERIEELGGIPLMFKTGHSLIKAKMKQEKAPLAGEMSGHIFFADRYFGFDDALYASLRLLEILSQGKKLSELAAQVPRYYATPEIRVETTEEEKFKLVEALKTFFKKEYKVIDIDGIRVDFGDGWGLLRPSNTQPVLVMRFEAQTQARLNEIQKLFLDKLEEYKKKGPEQKEAL